MELVSIKDGQQILGIKRAPSKDKTRVYTTYYCARAWSPYELDREDYGLAGVAVEEVQTTETFDIKVGDVVKFFYGKAIGDWQPVVDYKLLHTAEAAGKK